MIQPPLRFVHASDLHLERPLGDIDYVPDYLRALFLDAPYQAAKAVFDVALSESADAVLLAGDVVRVDHAGPRAVVFLQEQFGRLNAAGIPAFWAGGESDPPDGWPGCAPLPANVHVFAAGRIESHTLKRDDQPVAKIQGTSRSADRGNADDGFHVDPNGLFTVGVSYGTSAPPGAEGDRVHYMALGGQHRRQTVDQSPGIAHYCGTSQGRSPAEPGPRGCTIVSVDEAVHVKTKFVATDAVRWHDETVEITAGTDEASLQSQLVQRAEKLCAQNAQRTLLVTWRIRGRGELLNHIRSGGVSESITDDLRRKFGNGSPSLWTVAIDSNEPLNVSPETYDQETILGDVLRQFRNLAAKQETPLDLEEFMPEEFSANSLAELATVLKSEREQLLTSASKLAVEFLEADES